MTLAAAELQDHIALERPVESSQRPYTVVNMVTSVDGRITVGERVGSLTSTLDQSLLAGLRAQADVVLVGAATVRAEGYGRLLRDNEREARVAAGLDREPLLCVLTRSVTFDPVPEAFRSPEMRVIVATSSPDGELPTTGAQVDYLRYASDPAVPIVTLVEDLAHRYDARVCVCEGGPDVAAEVVNAGVCNELFVSVSPQLVGGLGQTGLLSAALRSSRTLRLRSLARGDDHVFLRYVVD